MFNQLSRRAVLIGTAAALPLALPLDAVAAAGLSPTVALAKPITTVDDGIRAVIADIRGMEGCVPWALHATLNGLGDRLAALIGDDAGAGFAEFIKFAAEQEQQDLRQLRYSRGVQHIPRSKSPGPSLCRVVWGQGRSVN